MQTKPLDKIPAAKLEELLAGIPFYTEWLSLERKQYKLLLAHSKLLICDSNEVIINKGDFDSWFYVILKGQVQIFPDESDQANQPVGYLGPGDMFGELALIMDSERTASVIADPNAKEVILLATDFSPFGDWDDFDQIKLETKLPFYRKVVEITQWKVNNFQQQFPELTPSGHLNIMPPFSGEPNSIEELAFLHKQAEVLAQNLCAWNVTLDHSGQLIPSRVELKANILGGFDLL